MKAWVALVDDVHNWVVQGWWSLLTWLPLEDEMLQQFAQLESAVIRKHVGGVPAGLERGQRLFPRALSRRSGLRRRSLALW